MGWNYFKPSEVVGLDTELVAMLDKARHRADVPFIITDGLRTGDGKQDRNAVNNSAHLSGLAADLRCRDYHNLWRMLDGIFSAGFKRVGIYTQKIDGKVRPTHVHVDADLTKPQEVMWITEEL